MRPIINIEGRFSRRLGEQIPDATYASAGSYYPRRHRWLDRLCWLIAVVMLTWLGWAALAAPVGP